MMSAVDVPIEHHTKLRLTRGGVIDVRCSCAQWTGVAPSVKVAERDATRHRQRASTA
jgi:hypothetical protein